MQMLFLFYEMYKRNSEQLLNLFSNDTIESKYTKSHYFTETVDLQWSIFSSISIGSCFNEPLI